MDGTAQAVGTWGDSYSGCVCGVYCIFNKHTSPQNDWEKGKARLLCSTPPPPPPAPATPPCDILAECLHHGTSDAGNNIKHSSQQDWVDGCTKASTEKDNPKYEHGG